jgi:hypothetical protein
MYRRTGTGSEELESRQTADTMPGWSAQAAVHLWRRCSCGSRTITTRMATFPRSMNNTVAKTRKSPSPAASAPNRSSNAKRCEPVEFATRVDSGQELPSLSGESRFLYRLSNRGKVVCNCNTPQLQTIPATAIRRCNASNVFSSASLQVSAIACSSTDFLAAGAISLQFPCDPIGTGSGPVLMVASGCVCDRANEYSTISRYELTATE